jgi:hypothetical protein
VGMSKWGMSGRTVRNSCVSWGGGGCWGGQGGLGRSVGSLYYVQYPQAPGV